MSMRELLTLKHPTAWIDFEKGLLTEVAGLHHTCAILLVETFAHFTVAASEMKCNVTGRINGNFLSGWPVLRLRWYANCT